jgi:hypothetical protein
VFVCSSIRDDAVIEGAFVGGVENFNASVGDTFIGGGDRDDVVNGGSTFGTGVYKIKTVVGGVGIVACAAAMAARSAA